jgi:DNA-binding CsgD family transcriptional regulator
MTDTTELSKRELEVVELLLQGKSNKQIALMLDISDRTVEFHLKNIYAKLEVSSRAEAILKLGKSTGIFELEPGKSAVESTAPKIDNRNEPNLQISEPFSTDDQPGLKVTGRIFGNYKILILIGLLAAATVVFVLMKSAAWEKIERECEYPDVETVGQMIWRSNASGSKVHGQFGTTAGAPWAAQEGYVIYKNINLPKIDQLYLRLRYSKNSLSSIPILVFLDNEPNPRASIYPKDQQNWDQFSWTEPIYLGSIEGGIHSIKFLTAGEQYGVADLDMFVLTKQLP